MEDVMRFPSQVATSLLFLAPLMAAAGPGSQRDARFPSEIQGVWDAYPLPCAADVPSDSDARIQIEGDVLHGYENNDALRSIEPIAESPMAWRVVTTSDIAPAEIQGEADIYVLRGNALTITNGERTHTFIRCR
jgi:hypothetical protein